MSEIVDLPKTDPRLDWNPRLDERSRRFAISTLVPVQPEVRKLWTPGPLFDQGREGACVGFAWTGELCASPCPDYTVPQTTGNQYASAYYRRCKQIDEWEGEDYSGTSVLAGAKVGRERGAWESYYWCFNMEDVRNAVISTGPVVIGVPWYRSMYRTADNGLVTVDKDSGLAGGHAILLTGYHPNLRLNQNGRYQYLRAFRWRNSWGGAYGYLNTRTGQRNGNGWIAYAQLEELFTMWGTEACIPVNRRPVRISQVA